MNDVRYFTLTSDDGSPVLTCLRRLRIGKDAMGEDRWDVSAQAWKDDTANSPIVRMLTIGQGDYDEIAPELARATWPEAFED